MIEIPEHIKAIDKDLQKIDRCIPGCPACASIKTIKQMIELLESGALSPVCNCGCWETFKKQVGYES